jgi:uncharacterized protein (TIGR02001 family)
VVSDYRDRGRSDSDGGPAVQGGVTAKLHNGAYASAWASSIAPYGVGPDGHGARVQSDLSLGWSGAVGGLDVDAAAQAHVYPGGTDVNFVEFPLSLSRAAGPWRWTLGGAYSPSQRALGHQDNLYAWGALAWEGQPWRVELRAGREDGAAAPKGKWDWSAGVSHAFGPVTAGLTYVDSDDPEGSATLVASLMLSF